jgi:polyhydroxyalkanoate synthesis repressor PhaR
VDKLAALRYSLAVVAAVRHRGVARGNPADPLRVCNGLPRSATVIRLIKRYGSRKLYDTEESRYVSLEEIGDWVRQGQQVQVVDNQNGDDVTAQTLTQVILEEGKRGMSPVSSDFLHALIRRGEQMVTTGVESLSQGVDRLLQASVDRVGPLRELRDEVKQMRAKIDVLESAISEMEEGRDPGTNGGQLRHVVVRPQVVRRKGAQS